MVNIRFLDFMSLQKTPTVIARYVPLLIKSLFPVGVGSLLVACSTVVAPQQTRSESRSSCSIRVGTYNVFTGASDSSATLATIRRINADVLAMQELSPQGARLLDRGLKQDYPYRVFSEGVAIVSRYPLHKARYQHSRRGINGFLIAEVESPGGRMQVASLHLDPLRVWTTREKWSLPAQLSKGQADIHRAEVKQIHEALRPGMPTILAGDFNSESGAALDEMQKLGFHDSFAQVTAHPDRTPTLRFKLLGVSMGRRIDCIMHDSSFETRESRVLPGHPSDHDPVMSVLSWKRAK